VLHAKPHMLCVHAECALATPLRQPAPHIMQLFGSLVVSTHVLLQLVGALGGHVGTHEYSPLTAAQSGVVPVHALPQPPQLDTVVPSTQPPGHATIPLAQTRPPSPTPASPANSVASLPRGASEAVVASLPGPTPPSGDTR
jgi:hypothetical protein